MIKLISLAAAALALAGLTPAAFAQSSASSYTSATRYDLMGRVTGTISPNDTSRGYNNFLATRTTYDAAGRPTRVESGYLTSWKSENVLPINWGADFNVISIVDTTYNAQNQKTTERVLSPALVPVSLTQYSYDSSGRLECAAVRMNPAIYGSLPSACTLGTQGSDGPDRIVKNVYDVAGQLVQVREGVGAGSTIEAAEVTYTYTNNGKLKFVIDAGGHKAEKRYDGYDRQVRWVFPSTTNPGAFDDSTPALAVSTAGALNESDYELYEYDNNGLGNGNRTKLRKRDGSELTYQYDFLNRMTVKVVPDRAGLDATHERDVYYTYDLRGLTTSARFDSTSGEGVIFGYDGFGRKTTETLSMDGATRTLTSQYDRNGNRTRLTWPDGNYVDNNIDGLNRLYYNLLNGAFPLFHTYFDPAGRLAGLYRWNNAAWGWGASTQYSYDNVSRLSAFWHDVAGTTYDSTWSFTRNPASQIASQTRTNDVYAWDGALAVNRNYTANGLNEYSAVAGVSFAYDANGNLTSDGVNTYGYDVENRMISRSGGGSTAVLRYDPLGRLYELWGSQAWAGYTRFVYDGDAMVAEYNGSWVMQRRHVHGTSAGDDPLVWFEGATVADSVRRDYYADQRGSIVATSDNNHTVSAAIRYDEYGIPRFTQGARFLYTGQMFSNEIGMYYYKARMYSPTLGRFMQTDPIGYDDQYNLYAYVGNDPVNFVDFDGRETGSVSHHSTQQLQQARIDSPRSPEELAQERGFAGAVVENVPIVKAPVIVVRAANRAGLLTRIARGVGRLFGGSRQSRCCFVAGTLVDTETGLRPIEAIEVGDKVWARDEETGETALKQVTDLIQRHERVIWEVSLNGPDGGKEAFETTDDHPWWIAGQGWKRTQELAAGMAVVTRDGRGMVLASVVETDRTDTTFNLTVADFETYFVGEQRVLVHNCPGFSRGTQGEIRARNQEAGGGTEHCESCGQIVQRQQRPNQRGQRIAPDRSEADHKQRRADGGSNDADNGQVLCHECHVEKTARENRIDPM